MQRRLPMLVRWGERMRVRCSHVDPHAGPHTSTYTFTSTNGSTHADRQRIMRANDLDVRELAFEIAAHSAELRLDRDYTRS